MLTAFVSFDFISIHASEKEATQIEEEILQIVYISIHASEKEATIFWFCLL